MPRPFDIIDAPQRSEAWHQARLGRLTGSRACDMLAKIQKGEAAKRRDLRVQLVCERLTGLPQDDGYISKEMQRGIDREDDARRAYEAVTGQLVRRSGFLALRGLMAGCSLDGCVGDFVGITEFKCPKSATHLSYLRGGVVPSDYLPQITHNLWVTGAAWADFASFDDRFPQPLQLFIVRVPKSSVDIDGYDASARAFLAEVEREHDAVATMMSISDRLKAAVA